MRSRDKIEKYLFTLLKRYNGDVIESEASRYFSFNNKVLRVSDHVGSNSSGSLSIIIPQVDGGDKYIVHAHCNGSISLIDYEHLKEFVRSFAYMSSFVESILAFDITNFATSKRDSAAANQQINTLTQKVKALEAKQNIDIKGLSLDDFTEAQRKNIESFIVQNKRNKKKK